MWPPEDKAKGKPRKPVKASFPFKLDKATARTSTSPASRNCASAWPPRPRPRSPRRATNVDDLIDEAEQGRRRPARTRSTSPAKPRSTSARSNLEGDIYKSSELRKRTGRSRDRSAQPLLLAGHGQPRLGRVDRPRLRQSGGRLPQRQPAEPSRRRSTTWPTSSSPAATTSASWCARSCARRPISAATCRRRARRRASPNPRRPSPPPPSRRMISETMFDSIVQAGHLFTSSTGPARTWSTVAATSAKWPSPRRTTRRSRTPRRPKNPVPRWPRPKAMSARGYDLERGIEVDFKDALKKQATGSTSRR